MSENIIEIKHLSKAFGEHKVLKDIDFSVKKGEVVCIIGSSGSGKSTLLRCINLLEKPSGGQIIYNGENILDDNHDICQYRTKLGMVFQQFNLFNNHNVLSNCVVGQMKVLGRSREEAEKIAMKYLQVVGMSNYINAKPKQLSGGQKQRVSIARTLLKQPEILIFDDSFSALDFITEHKLKEELKTYMKTVTTITISPKISSLIKMDRIIVMDNGKIAGFDTHENLIKNCSVYREICESQEICTTEVCNYE